MTNSTRHQRAGNRHAFAAAFATSVLVMLASGTVNAQDAPNPEPAAPTGYETTTTSPDKSLDVSGFSPECIRDAPFISYAIVPAGFTPANGNATLVIKDRKGTVVETVKVTSLTGTIIWPGASVNSQGQATDWPGWKLSEDGSWIPDPKDAILREGLTIDVSVNPTATTTVSYPPATKVCANPPGSSSKAPTTTAAAAAPPAVSEGSLPRTGGGASGLLIPAALALVVGLGFVAITRRRKPRHAQALEG